MLIFKPQGAKVCGECVWLYWLRMCWWCMRSVSPNFTWFLLSSCSLCRIRAKGVPVSLFVPDWPRHASYANVVRPVCGQTLADVPSEGSPVPIYHRALASLALMALSLKSRCLKMGLVGFGDPHNVDEMVVYLSEDASLQLLGLFRLVRDSGYLSTFLLGGLGFSLSPIGC